MFLCSAIIPTSSPASFSSCKTVELATKKQESMWLMGSRTHCLTYPEVNRNLRSEIWFFIDTWIFKQNKYLFITVYNATLSSLGMFSFFGVCLQKILLLLFGSSEYGHPTLTSLFTRLRFMQTQPNVTWCKHNQMSLDASLRMFVLKLVCPPSTTKWTGKSTPSCGYKGFVVQQWQSWWCPCHVYRNSSLVSVSCIFLCYCYHYSKYTPYFKITC